MPNAAAVAPTDQPRNQVPSPRSRPQNQGTLNKPSATNFSRPAPPFSTVVNTCRIRLKTLTGWKPIPRFHRNLGVKADTRYLDETTRSSWYWGTASVIDYQALPYQIATQAIGAHATARSEAIIQTRILNCVGRSIPDHDSESVSTCPPLTNRRVINTSKINSPKNASRRSCQSSCRGSSFDAAS